MNEEEHEHARLIDDLIAQALAAPLGVDLNPAIEALKIEIERLREQRNTALTDLALANQVIHDKAVEAYNLRARLDDGA